ncbi:MAG: M20 family metallo-hydrolase [Methanomassiliicoccales archaeon]
MSVALLNAVDREKESMLQLLESLVRTNAIGPDSGGPGEWARARLLLPLLKAMPFDEVWVEEVPDGRVAEGSRPNILALKKGPAHGGTLWLVAHLDTVPPGDLNLWNGDPYVPRREGGKLYGLGSEDNGQSLVGSMTAVRLALSQGRKLRMGIGLMLVADEEVGSDKGIKSLIDRGLFSKKDVFIVPDHGVADGGEIEVAEKHILWLRLSVKGRQSHASLPGKGLNASRVSIQLRAALLNMLPLRFGGLDPIFEPPTSTFEPTKHLANVQNINTIPAEDVSFLDMRILPTFNVDEVLASVKEMAAGFAQASGAEIAVDIMQMTKSAPASDIHSECYLTLAQAVEEVRGRKPKAVGIGGGTCANIFRQHGYPSYAWQTVEEMMHSPNEYCVIENLVRDAKVFALVLERSCLEK